MPEEIIFEIISETPLGENPRHGEFFSKECQKSVGKCFSSAPEEIIFGIISETPLGNVFLSAPEEVIFGISSEISWEMISLLHQRKLFFGILSETPLGDSFLCASEEIILGLIKMIVFLRQRKLFSE